MKTAIITGINGQDAPYLAQHLLKLNYKVIVADRRRTDNDYTKLAVLGIDNQVIFEYFDLLELSNIINVISKYKPDEFYNLAAQSFVGASFTQPLLTSDINSLGLLRILEAIRLFSPKTKLYQASTSEMFGKVKEIPQSESTPFHPRSPYGVSKVFSHYMVVNYREAYNLFACSGILFNHESPFRGKEFVTKKITSSIAKIIHGKLDYFEIGNLDAKRDWGYAKDFVKGMHLMLQQDIAEDFVLCTGKMHSVREFIELAFQHVNINIQWIGTGSEEFAINTSNSKKVVQVSKEYYRPAEVDLLIGDSSKAEAKLNWRSETSLKELVEIMMKYDLEYEGKD
jgi:GDPmannose 4,6-dehydratase